MFIFDLIGRLIYGAEYAELSRKAQKRRRRRQ